MSLEGKTGVNITATGQTVNITSNVLDINTSNTLITGAITADNDTEIKGILNVTNTTESTSKTVGAVVISGGLGVEKDVYFGTNLNVAGNLNIKGNIINNNKLYSNELIIKDKLKVPLLPELIKEITYYVKINSSNKIEIYSNNSFNNLLTKLKINKNATENLNEEIKKYKND
jgi:hypothetical protein